MTSTINQHTTPALPVRLEHYEIDAATGCWLWQGWLCDGYGRISIGGTRVGTHVAAWALANGRWPADGEQVRHSCDVRRCINPAHLAIGTHTDNMGDRSARGRTARGERAASHRLTAGAVIEIRRRCSSGESFSALGRAFNVHYMTIARAVRGQTWSHIGPDPTRRTA